MVASMAVSLERGNYRRPGLRRPRAPAGACKNAGGRLRGSAAGAYQEAAPVSLALAAASAAFGSRLAAELVRGLELSNLVEDLADNAP